MNDTIAQWDAALRRRARPLGLLLDGAIGLTVGILLLLVASQFIDRNLWPFWIDSPEEYVKIGLTWLCFLGIVRSFSTGDVIRITFLLEILPQPLARAAMLAVDLILVCTLFVLAFKSWSMIQVARMQLILGTSLTLDFPGYALLTSFVLLIPLALWRLLRVAFKAEALH